MHAKLAEKNEIALDKKKILTKALCRLAIELNLSRQELSLIMGLSEATFSRIFNTQGKDKKASYLDPSSKEGQLAILLLRLYKSLAVLFGGNAQQCQLWLRSENKHLEGKPIDNIKLIEGLVTVVQYLDAMRGKN